LTFVFQVPIVALQFLKDSVKQGKMLPINDYLIANWSNLSGVEVQFHWKGRHDKEQTPTACGVKCDGTRWTLLTTSLVTCSLEKR